MKSIRRSIQIAVVALAASGVVSSASAEMIQFKSGDVLTAQQLNQNFSSADHRLDEQAKEVLELKIIAGLLAALTACSIGVAVRRRR